MRQAVTSEQLAPVAGPFSPAVRDGDVLYVSGQVGQDPATGLLVKGGVADQAEQIFRNVEVILQTAGKRLTDVIRVGVYLTDMADFAAMNEVYLKYLRPPFPARTTVGVAALPMGARIELDLIAH